MLQTWQLRLLKILCHSAAVYFATENAQNTDDGLFHMTCTKTNNNGRALEISRGDKSVRKWFLLESPALHWMSYVSNKRPKFRSFPIESLLYLELITFYSRALILKKRNWLVKLKRETERCQSVNESSSGSLPQCQFMTLSTSPHVSSKMT